MAFTNKSFKLVLSLNHDRKYPITDITAENLPIFHHLWTAEDCLPADGTAENICQSMKMSTEDLTVCSQLDACYLVSNSCNIVYTIIVVSLR